MPEGRVAIVGSGFAGSILARVLNRVGFEVTLLERLRHPRFALGESSTPLANFCLERLAARYGLEDLHDLAAYGRWMARMPQVRRGLKRGFTFYHHHPGRPFESGPDNQNRLLVAASPQDALADSHWLRQDVDRFLAERAVEEGVDLRQECEVVTVEERDTGFALRLRTGAGSEEELETRFVIDATGPRGVVLEGLGSGDRSPAARFRSRLIYAHFAGVAPMDEESSFEPGPYPDRRAAVHHLLDEGWLYLLEFDDDRVSAGLILDQTEAGTTRQAPGDTAAKWQATLERYPSLARQFDGARLLRPLAELPTMQHRRLRAAAGSQKRAWAALPHALAFLDPMFSTGIAWSLLGVERLGLAFEPAAGQLAPRLAAYDRLLRLEAEQIERLIYGAYLARRDPRRFAALSHLYFAAVSWEELRQRLLVDCVAEAPWRGFLGAGQAGWESLFEEAVSRLRGLARTPDAAAVRATRRFEQWIASSIAPYNLIGLADPARRNLYPVDLEVVAGNASLLGMSPEELRGLLPRLRGG